MSGFLRRLSQRVIAPATLVRPRLPSLFDPNTEETEEPQRLQQEREAISAPQTRAPRAMREQSQPRNALPDRQGAAAHTVISRVAHTNTVRSGIASSAFASTSGDAIPKPALGLPSAQPAPAAIPSTPHSANAEAAPSPTAARRADPAIAAIPAPRQSVTPTTRGTALPRSEVSGERDDLREPASPTVRVTIGRIEVRAADSPAQRERKPASVRARTSVALDDYLSGSRRK